MKHIPVTTASHVATCSDPTCGNGENPPTGGPHCPSPTACRTWTVEQPICNWVHNLEHGHVALLYNCPGGCADVTSALDGFRNQAKASAGVARALVTPDSTLPKKVGVVVWGYSWIGDEVNEDAIRCVMAHQDEEAPEAGLGCSP